MPTNAGGKQNPKTEDALTKVSKGGFADFLPDMSGVPDTGLPTHHRWLPPHIADKLPVNTGVNAMAKPHCPSIQDGCDCPEVCNANGYCQYTGTEFDQRRREVYPGVPRVDDVIVPPPEPDAYALAERILPQGQTLPRNIVERMTASVDKILEVRRLSMTPADRVKNVMEGVLNMTYSELTDFADMVHRRSAGTSQGAQAVALALTESAKYKLEQLAKGEKPPE
jgi:hypothetical protein